MDVKFDANAALSLLKQMDKYCSSIVKETRNLMTVVNNSGDWQDTQSQAFQENIIDIAKDLDRVLALESEYMRTYDRRIKELVG